MSAWGQGGIAKSCDSLLRRVEGNDPTLTDLIILPTKTFGSNEVDRLAQAIGPNGRNTYLQSLSASGHTVPLSSLTTLGKAIAAGSSRPRAFKNLAIGTRSLGDEGVAALCKGLAEESSSSGSSIPLERVDLSMKGIGSQGLEAIVQTFQGAEKLRTLILSRNEAIGSSALFQRRSNEAQQSPPPPSILPHITELDLSECDMTGEACAGLVECLGPLSSNRHLVLRLNSNVRMGSLGGTSLSTLLSKSSLVQLHLSKCKLGDEGLTSIVNRATKDNDLGLQVVDISHNQISPIGLHLLATRLKEGTAWLPQLTELNLAGNQFDEDSVQSFAAALAALYHPQQNEARKETESSNTTSRLSQLDMSNTLTGIGGAVDLVRLSQLTKLTLFNNQLGSEGFLELAKVLQGGHPTLELLDVGGNHANQASVVSLLHALTLPPKNNQNNRLRVLIVGGNEGGPAVEQMVDTVKSVWPKLDIARDKPRKPNE